jgi:hypothetical protein
MQILTKMAKVVKLLYMRVTYVYYYLHTFIITSRGISFWNCDVFSLKYSHSPKKQFVQLRHYVLCEVTTDVEDSDLHRT